MISLILSKLIRFYQLALSPLIGPCCRFYPSCSNYALEAIDRFGPSKGLFMTFKRLLRCGPWSKGGVDPVVEEDGLP